MSMPTCVPPVTARGPAINRSWILVVSGCGVRVGVQGGHLIVEDAVGADRRAMSQLASGK
jgi:hypothetical protein